MSSRMFFLGTDVATLFVLHPEDLRHTHDWPTGWYDEAPVWQAQSRAGLMVAWGTRSDGGFRARFTTTGLTQEEASLATATWTFPYTVRHGRVLYDNSDAFPGGSGPGDLKDTDWFDIDNGDYLVTVTGIHWTDTGETPEEAAKRLPHYVVNFEPAKGAEPAIAQRVPDLGWGKGAEATDGPHETRYPPFNAYAAPSPDYVQKTRASPKSPVAACTVATITLDGRLQSSGESDLEQLVASEFRNLSFRDQKPGMPKLMGSTFFAAPSPEPGSLGLLCTLSGVSSPRGKPKTFSLSPSGPARLLEIAGRLHEGEIIPLRRRWPFGKSPPPLGDFKAPLLAVRVEPIFPDETNIGDIDTAALKSALLTRFSQQSSGLSQFHHARVSAMSDPAWMVRTAMEHLPWDSDVLLGLSAMDLPARAAEILRLLNTP